MDYYFRKFNVIAAVNASCLNRFNDPSDPVSNWIYIIKNSGTLFEHYSQENELRVNDSECLCVRDKWEF